MIIEGKLVAGYLLRGQLAGKACCDGGSLYKVYAMLVGYISCWRCVDMLFRNCESIVDVDCEGLVLSVLLGVPPN